MLPQQLPRQLKTVVKRDNVDGTVFTLLDTDILSADTAVHLVKDGQLLFKPYHMVNGVLVPKPGWTFRLGRLQTPATFRITQWTDSNLSPLARMKFVYK